MDERHYPYLHYLLIITAVLVPAILVSGCAQSTGPNSVLVSELLENTESYYDKPVAVVGKVSELGEVLCSCFKLTSGGDSVHVWYDTMVMDNGAEMPAVSVEGINNGDEVIVTGVLQRGTTHTSPNDFWATSIRTSEPLVGGDKDEHGCIPSAGYTWCEALEKCLRTWEEECPTLCTEDQRNVDACIEIYQPVCGWSDPEKVQCVTYPCASDYSNSCFACMDGNVKYWTEGPCPSPGSGGGSSLLTREQALALAEYSKCVKNGTLTGTYSYNEFTQTWWFDLRMNPGSERQGCSPACVVWEGTSHTEINWRCTGLLPE